MTIDILMPAIGAGTTQGKIIQWLKKQGDHVAMGDILAEIETDKAVIELEALDEGVLQEVLVDAGEEVLVGVTIARLSDATEGVSEQPAKQPAQVLQQPPLSAVAPQNEVKQAPATAIPVRQDQHPKHVASPSARRLARELGVDITALSGSGYGGRIVRIDIENAATDRPLARMTTQTTDTEFTDRIPHTNMRKTVARRLQEAKQQIPHFYLSVDCDMDAVMAMREQLNKELSASENPIKISLNDILVYAISRSVAHEPGVNARWTDEAIILNKDIDVSVAVSTDRGLFTPIIRQADRKTLGAISTELKILIDKARAARLKPQEYEGGSLTISNLGMYGIKEFSAIINPPQAAILAMGAVIKQAVVKNDVLCIGHVMTITLSADHRVIDGAVGARFLAQIKKLLEAPYLLLV